MKHRIEVRVKNKEKVLDGRVMKLPARLVHGMQSVCTPITASPALPRKREPDSAD